MRKNRPIFIYIDACKWGTPLFQKRFCLVKDLCLILLIKIGGTNRKENLKNIGYLFIPYISMHNKMILIKIVARKMSAYRFTED